MSGGSLDYAYEKLNDVASDVRSSAGYREHNYPELRLAMAEHLEKMAKVVHAIEWSDSGDWKRDAWVPYAEQYIGLMDLIQDS